jgi:hypothetical protein
MRRRGNNSWNFLRQSGALLEPPAELGKTRSQHVQESAGRKT